MKAGEKFLGVDGVSNVDRSMPIDDFQESLTLNQLGYKRVIVTGTATAMKATFDHRPRSNRLTGYSLCQLSSLSLRHATR